MCFLWGTLGTRGSKGAGEMGSGEAFDEEGSGDNEEGYDGDLQYKEKSE